MILPIQVQDWLACPDLEALVSFSGMILAADLGTSSLKAGLITPDGNLTSFVRVFYENSPLNGFVFEPKEWENAFNTALKRLPAARINSISLSGNGPTVVACTPSGQPISPVSLWLDDSGLPLEGHASYYLPKVAWLRRIAEHVWPPNTHIFTCPEWLQFRLGGRAEIGIPSEAFRPYVWDNAQIAAYGLGDLVFPRILPMGSIAGGVSASAASRHGLNEGTPLVLAGSDFLVALLGTGTMKPGIICDRAGTSETINFCSSVHPGEMKGKGISQLQVIPHVIEPNWNIAANLSSTGAAFEWYRSITGQAEKSYERIMAEIDMLPLDEEIPFFIPHSMQHCFWNFNGAKMVDLKFTHLPTHLGRAIMYSICFAFKHALLAVKELGFDISGIRVSGGQAHCREWNQMKSDITGHEVTVPTVPDAELIGGACCAAFALGYYDSLPEACESYVRMAYILEPRPKYQAACNNAWLAYKEAEQILLENNS